MGDHVVGDGEDDLFRTFMDNSPLVAFIADAEDRMVYSSAPLPLTPEQVGASMWDLLPEEYIEAYRLHMHAARETGEAQQLIGPGPSQDGRPGWFRTHYFPLPGRWVGGVGLDVTELVDAQAELATARDQQAGLRLVATLVAQEADEQTVLEASAEAAGRVLAARVSLARLDRTDLRSPPNGMTATSADSDGAEPPSEEELAACRDEPYVLHRPSRRGCLGAPVTDRGKTWGLLVATFAADVDPPAGAGDLLRDFAYLVALSVANHASRREVTESRRRIVEAGQVARERLERDLHDSVQQRLITELMLLRRTRLRLAQDTASAQELLDESIAGLETAVEELREIAHGIHPSVLARSGLTAALRGLSRRFPLPTTVESDLPDRADPATEAALYFACSELLTNIAKYAEASAVVLRLRSSGREISLEVHDDGTGQTRVRPGGGLEGLRDRLTALGGRLDVRAVPGQGSHVTATVPIGKGAAPDSASRGARPVHGATPTS